MPAGHLSHRQIANHWPEIECLFRGRTGENHSPAYPAGLAGAQHDYEIETMAPAELANYIQDIIACLEIPD